MYEKLTANATKHGVDLMAYPMGLAAHEGTERFAYYPRYTMMSGVAAYADAAGEVEVIKTYLRNELGQGLEGRDELLEHAEELLDERFWAEAYECAVVTLSSVIWNEGVDRIDLPENRRPASRAGGAAGDRRRRLGKDPSGRM